MAVASCSRCGVVLCYSKKLCDENNMCAFHWIMAIHTWKYIDMFVFPVMSTMLMTNIHHMRHVFIPVHNVINGVFGVTNEVANTANSRAKHVQITPQHTSTDLYHLNEF